jgi:hypothetical protein
LAAALTGAVAASKFAKAFYPINPKLWEALNGQP